MKSFPNLQNMDIYVYSDESGVFDRQHNEYFVFGGLVALSYSEADEATRRYQHAEKLIKAKEGLANDDEAKACCLSNSGKSKLFRSLNNFHKFGVVIHQNRVNPNIFNNKKTKQRYLDYAFKIAIKRKFEALIREGTIEPCKVSKIRFYVDEHATATDGRYELREALEQEFKGSSSKALSNFAPRELLSITQAKFLCKRLFRVLLKSFLRLGRST